MRNNQTQILSYVECWEHEALGTTSFGITNGKGLKTIRFYGDSPSE
jgi:hypothetical protein